ncbi:RUS family member 1 [Onthophagus taurus]|uniref:RUS family member 1 n=1 Tax=Onthophagus taurus TaxID=166361 RepID=UPI000C20AC2F|nr:RUS1 family protein C16orf58 homolog [Onthophagus taurus]
MNGLNVIIKEQQGSLGEKASYTTRDGRKILRLSNTTNFSKNIAEKIKSVLREIYLPHGYPESVSEDYKNYQIWDTCQAFCSTITGTFTTQAILKGVGVGNAEATPLAAAITWVIKDGTGMLGRIIFAWWKGNSLDADCKKWRLFADFLNDIAMLCELSVPYFSEFSMQFLCATTTMKAVVGVAGGATRASITQHQAIKGNMADVSAKDGSQETIVNLIASIFGIILLAFIKSELYVWIVFIFFTSIHLLTNYFAVGSLIFKHLNTMRLLLVIKTYLKLDTVSSVLTINSKEPLILGLGPSIKNLCGFNIKLGCSLQQISKTLSVEDLEEIISVYDSKNYLIIPNFQDNILYVPLLENEKAETVVSAFFHAVMMGIALCKYNNLQSDTNIKRQLRHITPVIRLNVIMKSFPRNETGDVQNFPAHCLNEFNEYINFEVHNFFTALKINGWNTNIHALDIDSWRYSFCYDKDS